MATASPASVPRSRRQSPRSSGRSASWSRRREQAMQLSREQLYTGELQAAHVRHRHAPLAWRMDNGVRHRARSIGQLAAAAIVGATFGLITVKPQLAGVHYRPDRARLDAEQWTRLLALLRQNAPVQALAAHFGGQLTDYGVLSRRVSTTAEASGDTALVTERTPILNPDSTRATGSLTEGASANIFRTVGTVSFDGAGAITEHGIFSQAATGGGTLWDRSVFSAINVVSGGSIQFTYDMTASAGG